MKTSKDTDVIEHIGMVYVETKVVGNYLIGCNLWWKQERKDNDVIDRTSVFYVENDIEFSIKTEPLKTWHDVINLEFIIYLMMFQFHFYLSLFHVLYFMSILVYIFCIVRDVGTLGVAQKI